MTELTREEKVYQVSLNIRYTDADEIFGEYYYILAKNPKEAMDRASSIATSRYPNDPIYVFDVSEDDVMDGYDLDDPHVQ